MTEGEIFMEELLQEAEAGELKLQEAHVDLMLLEIQKSEKQIEQAFTTAELEKKIIHDWALKKTTIIKEKVDFMKLRLKAYLQERGLKTLDLPHGTLKFRKSPDKVEVVDIDKFMTVANSDMITIIPEHIKPDLNKLKGYIKCRGEYLTAYN